MRNPQHMSDPVSGPQRKAPQVAPSHFPGNVAALGFVSMLMAASSQMTHSLLPIYLVTVMGASTTTVGLIEGLAEATNSFIRAFSGAFSDWIGRRKPMVVLGYGLSACVKPLFPLAGDVATILVARLFDRTGKGIRDAPRDALLADQLPSNIRGSGFGLRISLFTIGSCLGPLLAAAIMASSFGNFRLVFWVAVAPALLSVFVLVTRVAELPRAGSQASWRLDRKNLSRLPAPYWWVVAIGSVIALSRFSQAFLLLKAKDIGVEIAMIPVYLALMGFIYGVTAYPFGLLADWMDRRIQLGLGAAVLASSHLVLAAADTSSLVIVGTILWGFQLGIIDGLLRASVADTAPEDLRGTAFGVFYLCVGVASLAASTAAGALWVAGGAVITFNVGSAIALIALTIVMVGRSHLPAGA
jgi:MFS family permease